MSTTRDRLPSWRPGRTREALLDLLDSVDEVDPARRVAVFDNDGTLWCERPHYPQFDFLVAELRARAASDRSVQERPEYGALLDGDAPRLAELGLVRVALALVELFDGMTPTAFETQVRAFFDRARHPTGRSYRQLAYVPMLELIAALRQVGITPVIATGGGAEFVRAISHDLYGIPPWHVIGTTVTYQVEDRDGVPNPRRTATLLGEANEGAQKVANLHLHLGTRPVLAAGNSAGDAQMLDYVQGADGDGLALLLDHDDPEREFRYDSRAGTFEAEPVMVTAARRGWAVVSMRDDWRVVFGDDHLDVPG